MGLWSSVNICSMRYSTKFTVFSTFWQIKIPSNFLAAFSLVLGTFVHLKLATQEAEFIIYIDQNAIKSLVLCQVSTPIPTSKVARTELDWDWSAENAFSKRWASRCSSNWTQNRELFSFKPILLNKFYLSLHRARRLIGCCSVHSRLKNWEFATVRKNQYS